MGFVNGIFDEYNIKNKLLTSDLNFRSNDSTIKLRKKGVAPQKAKLSPEAKKTLINYYTPFVRELEQMISKDLNSWLEY